MNHQMTASIHAGIFGQAGVAFECRVAPGRMAR
jgi:hypothetical protein